MGFLFINEICQDHGINGRYKFSNVAPPPNAVYPEIVPKQKAGWEKDHKQAKPRDDHWMDAIAKSLKNTIREDTYRCKNKSWSNNPC